MENRRLIDNQDVINIERFQASKSQQTAEILCQCFQAYDNHQESLTVWVDFDNHLDYSFVFDDIRKYGIIEKWKSFRHMDRFQYTLYLKTKKRWFFEKKPVLVALFDYLYERLNYLRDNYLKYKMGACLSSNKLFELTNLSNITAVTEALTLFLTNKGYEVDNEDRFMIHINDECKQLNNNQL